MHQFIDVWTDSVVAVPLPVGFSEPAEFPDVVHRGEQQPLKINLILVSWREPVQSSLQLTSAGLIGAVAASFPLTHG